MRGQTGLRPCARQNDGLLQRFLQRAVMDGSDGLNAGAGAELRFSGLIAK